MRSDALVHAGKYHLKFDKNWAIRGISSVELAIILPVFLLLVFGIIQFGIGWWVSQVITNGAREGARYAVVVRDPPTPDYDINKVQPDPASVEEIVRNYIGSLPNNNQATVEVFYDDGASTFDTCTRGCEVKVLVTIPIRNVIPALFPMIPSALESEAVMRHE
jgi:Flp pilus assembly protein TadG